MEPIHVKFDELTAMTSECNNSGPGFNCLNFQNSSKDSKSIPSTKDLDNWFGPLYEEYYATRSLELLDNSAANTLDNKDTPSSSLIVVEENEPPKIVSSSKEHVTIEPTTLVSNDNADESELVTRPADRNVIKVKWLWKNKTDAENTVIQNKSRLVAKGYSQQEGIDFEESFALVA
ncbi:retrovirus-related pol polyprotein from transposon TNT 1-94 [Tanacetum coccineum]